MTKGYVGIGEAAKILELSRTSIQKLVDSGQLAAVRTTGGHRRIIRESIEELNQKIGPKAMLRLAAKNPGLAPPVSSETISRPDKVQVLVVEDDPVTAALLTGIFSKSYPEVQCTVATDGLDAVLQLERTRPRIMITDLRMEPFDGFKLIQMVSARAEYQCIAMIAISGMSDSDIEKRGGLPNHVLFLGKPVNLDRLRGFLEAHVQMHRQNR
ncbi:response regulator [Polaromonas sp.]|uniref:response regulator n=1 Tax=Polaromonas sp. TaxID=1869339 RepID=UPI0035621884